MRRLLLLTSAVVFLDTMYFAALTPLLPHFAEQLDLGKSGAGVLAAAYPSGALLGAIPSGMVAVRFGAKRTVIVGLTIVALCTVLFGLASAAWELDVARFAQGVASAFSWTGAMAWLVARAPTARRGQLIGDAFGAAVAGDLFGPILGTVASFAGLGWTFGTVAVLSFALAGCAIAMPADPRAEPQPLRMLATSLRDREMQTGAWLVMLPALLFGTLSVLAPLRLSALGFGAAAIGATFLCSAALEAGNNTVLGRVADRIGTRRPLLVGLAASTLVAVVLPWPGNSLLLAVCVVAGGLAFGALFTPAMTMLATRSEGLGLGYGYTFALINLAWAPGQSLGAAGGGALAQATADAVPYLLLAGLCAVSFAGLASRR